MKELFEKYWNDMLHSIEESKEVIEGIKTECKKDQYEDEAIKVSCETYLLNRIMLTDSEEKDAMLYYLLSKELEVSIEK